MTSPRPFVAPSGTSPAPTTQVGWEALRAASGPLEVGDVVHVRGKGFASRAIRWFTRAMGEERSWASHTAVVLRVDPEGTLIEAVDLKSVQVRPLRIYHGTGARLLATRIPGGLTTPQKEALAAKLLEYKDRRYGALKIVLHALDRLLDNAYFFRRLSGDRYPICSWLAAFGYDRVLGYRFGCEPDAAQPDDILDHCMRTGWSLAWVDDLDSLASLRVVYARQGRDAAAFGPIRRLDVKPKEDVDALLARRRR